jgi:hypothetical protein
MTPGEVKGLQALAVQHGGSLTINPKTGLPEAGFLSKLIPVLAGIASVALAPVTGGASLWAVPLLTGGITGAVTGDMGKGLMAGLGAWGAGGVAGGLAKGFAGAGAGLAGAGARAGVGGASGVFGTAGRGIASQSLSAAPAGASGVFGMAGRGIGSQTLSGIPAGGGPGARAFAPPTNVMPDVTGAQQSGNSIFDAISKTTADLKPGLTQGMTDVKNAGSGLERLITPGAEGSAMRTAMMESSKLPMLAMGASLLAPSDERRPINPNSPTATFDPNYRAYRTYDPSARSPDSSAERMYYARDGGLMSLADGGTVENMSKLNTMGANTGYPMAYQNTPSYATSSANPISENVISPQGDANIDPYSGAERFAEGGKTTHAEDVAEARKKGIYIPEYNYYDDKTGQYSWKNPPPKVGITPEEIAAGYKNVFGRSPSDSEFATHSTSKLNASEFQDWLKQSPEYMTNPASDLQIGAAYRDILGRDANAGDLAIQKDTPLNMSQLRQTLLQSPEYASKSRTSPLELASIYKDVLKRPPSRDELDIYKNTPLTAAETRKQVMGSEEALNRLTKSFIPKITYDTTGHASIEGAQPDQTNTSPLELASIYKDVFKRVPSRAEFDIYKNTPLTAAETKKQVMGSEEYLNRLTKQGDNINAELQQHLAPQGPALQFAAPPSVQEPQPVRQAPTNQDQTAAMAKLREDAMKARDPSAGANSAGNVYSAGSVQYAAGGLSGLPAQYNLGGYSDGGRLLKGPGDGVSDSIPARIGNRQPARLADGEFVIPARIVSELGNGSTDAGARRLYAMMDRIQKSRSKTVGKGKVAVNNRAHMHLPA